MIISRCHRSSGKFFQALSPAVSRTYGSKGHGKINTRVGDPGNKATHTHTHTPRTCVVAVIFGGYYNFICF